MKQFRIAVLGIGFAAIAFSSCQKVIGEGPVVTEPRAVTDFSGIDLRMSGNVYYTQGNNYKVEVRAQQNILKVLQTYVSNNKLVVKLDNDTRVRRHEDITIHVTSPGLNSLRVSGSGSITTAGSFTTDDLDMDISGSGDITIADITTSYLDAKISGSGDMNVINGSAAEEKLKISGSGSLDLSNVTAKKVATTTTGSGNTRVNVADLLDVNITGSGSVYYKGQPKVNTKITGSGKVKSL